MYIYRYQGGAVVKNPPANAGETRHGLRVGKIPWRRKWEPTPVFLPGKSHGQRTLAGYSPWCCQESDRTEQVSMAQYMLVNKSSFLNIGLGLLKVQETWSVILPLPQITVNERNINPSQH